MNKMPTYGGYEAISDVCNIPIIIWCEISSSGAVSSLDAYYNFLRMLDVGSQARLGAPFAQVNIAHMQ